MQKLTYDDRMALTRATLNLLDDWGLQARDMISVLDMPKSVKIRNFWRYRDEVPFPDDPQVMNRIRYLLKIAEALRTTYPRNPEMGMRWMKQTHRRLGRRSPLAMIVNEGENGMVAVLSELDCSYAWDQIKSHTV